MADWMHDCQHLETEIWQQKPLTCISSYWSRTFKIMMIKRVVKF